MKLNKCGESVLSFIKKTFKIRVIFINKFATKKKSKKKHYYYIAFPANQQTTMHSKKI